MKHKRSLLFLFLMLIILANTHTVYATEVTVPDIPTPTVPSAGLQIEVNTEGITGEITSPIQLIVLITIITVAPSILLMMTCFTRIIIVMHFLKSALGTQQVPPSQVLIGLTLFLTLFVMGPVFSDIQVNALEPYSAGEITQEVAFERAMEPIRDFMFRQSSDKDINLFLDMEGEFYDEWSEIPNRILIPAFIIGELKKGFIMGFIIYIPFLVIDMVVASTLMAMGMMMLPPAMISMPFKILLFVLVDGWDLIIGNLIRTFQ